MLNGALMRSTSVFLSLMCLLLGSASSAHAESAMKGSATFRAQLPASKDFALGMKALDARLYIEAEKRLSRASIELRKTRSTEKERTVARLGLAEAYLAMESPARARTVLTELRGECFAQFGAESVECARYNLDFADLLYQEGKYDAAIKSAEQALKTMEKSGKPFDAALCHILIGKIETKQTYYDHAKQSFKAALPALELEPGRDRLDYAEALYGLSIAEKKLGNEADANELMKKSLALKDDAVQLDKTDEQLGQVQFHWIDGMPGSRQIGDPLYPLKYMVIDGLRVACTLVRSQKHMAVLISLANCSKSPMAVAVGKVTLEKVNPGRKFLYYCDPAYLDNVLEEDVVLGLTWRRRWLEHIQRSRKIPGYLKNGSLDPDDFYGNNVFGVYGGWDSNLRDLPPVVTREEYYYESHKHQTPDNDLLAFMRGSASSIRPTIIEPGSARTGLVLFLRDRYDDAEVTLHLGNAVVKFPFHVPAGIGGYPAAH